MSFDKWNKEFELNYFKNKVPSTDPAMYENELYRKYAFLRADYYISKLDQANKFLDVGAGSYGGMLRFLPHGKTKVVADPLANEFKDLDHLPQDVSAIECNAENLPFEDEDFDVVFSCEALDHVDNREVFDKAILESFRVTREGGLIFFEMHIRPKPIQCHPISLECVSVFEIIEMFKDKCSVLLFVSLPEQSPGFGSPNPIVIVAKK